MPYAGHTFMARDAVSLIAPHWPNSKVKATATMLGESSLSVGAWHDNQDLITDIEPNTVVVNVETYEPTIVLDPVHGKVKLSDGSVVFVPTTTSWIVSRDCGLYEINIPASLIHSDQELALRTSNPDMETYMGVARANVDAAYAKYTQPWVRDGKADIRRWQPWVAYTTGWAMFPEAWIWHQVDDVPVGPWVPTGRFLHKAIRGVANWHLLVTQKMTPDQALAEAQRLQEAYGAKGTLKYDSKQAVYWVYPPAPTAPPADGVGPRPVKNNGF